ncbi:hypothetical protein BT69DRAFT_1387229 [Atractiella rhizophila]|nr:hypothetical protein BT69DRAFT_1387229 [Atractiella rhizophila]
MPAITLMNIAPHKMTVPRESRGDTRPVILEDVLLLIFCFMRHNDLSACCRVSSSWNAVAQPILERRRHFMLSLAQGDDTQGQMVVETERQLIRSRNVRNIRHLTLWTGGFESKRLNNDNPSCISMFEVLQDVAPYLTSLRIAFYFPSLGGAFTFPPFPMLRSLTVDNTDAELPFAFDEAFPHLSVSSLRELFLKGIDQLSAFHLACSTLVHLEVATRRGDIDEETRRRFRSLASLKRLQWISETAPVNCILPISITDLTLWRKADRGLNPQPWSIELAFPNFPDLSNLSSLVLLQCLPLSANFPNCKFKISELGVDGSLWREGDGIFKLLHNSATSLSKFDFPITSNWRFRELLYFCCGGRNNPNPTFVDAFRAINSRLSIVDIHDGRYGFEDSVQGDLECGRLMFYWGAGAADIAAALQSAITEGSLPALKLVSLQLEMDREAMESFYRLGSENQFEVQGQDSERKH